MINLTKLDFCNEFKLAYKFALLCFVVDAPVVVVVVVVVFAFCCSQQPLYFKQRE